MGEINWKFQALRKSHHKLKHINIDVKAMKDHIASPVSTLSKLTGSHRNPRPMEGRCPHLGCCTHLPSAHTPSQPNKFSPSLKSPWQILNLESSASQFSQALAQNYHKGNTPSPDMLALRPFLAKLYARLQSVRLHKSAVHYKVRTKRCGALQLLPAIKS